MDVIADVVVPPVDQVEVAVDHCTSGVEAGGVRVLGVAYVFPGVVQQIVPEEAVRVLVDGGSGLSCG